jgi:hypothetical protein
LIEARVNGCAGEPCVGDEPVLEKGENPFRGVRVCGTRKESATRQAGEEDKKKKERVGGCFAETNTWLHS